MIAFLKRQFVRLNWRRVFKLSGFLAACCGCVVLWSLAIHKNRLASEIGHANPSTPASVVVNTTPEAR